MAESGGMLVQHSESVGLARRRFTSARQLRDAIDAFVEVYNDKAVVHLTEPKPICADLCK
jgi:hypothetical protein